MKKNKRNLKSIYLSELLTRDIQVSLEAEGRTREAVAASGYFTGDETRVHPALLVNMAKFYDRRALSLLLGLISEETVTLIEEVSAFCSSSSVTSWKDITQGTHKHS